MRFPPRNNPPTLHPCTGWYLGVRINGKGCSQKDVVVVGKNCDRGHPHNDPEGMVCANDGQFDEGYCSYDIGETVCAYCKAHVKGTFASMSLMQNM